MKHAFLTLSLLCAFAHLSALQPAGLPMGATDLISDERFEAYKVESHVYKTVVLSKSFVPAQDANAWPLENLTFDGALEIESSQQLPEFVNNYENCLPAISEYNTQLQSLQQQLNRIKNEISSYAEGARLEDFSWKGVWKITYRLQTSL
jgi:hypothetical protein